VLARSRPQDNIDDEIEGIREAPRSQQAFRLRQLLGPRLRMLLLVGAGMVMFQQILGINTVIYYGATILKFAAVAFFIWKLPETKDRILEDIERQVRG
jgi:hypothetical protein